MPRECSPSGCFCGRVDCARRHRPRRLIERLLGLVALLYLLASLGAFLLALLRLLRRCFSRGARDPQDHDREPSPAGAGFVPPYAIRVADPLIYSQEWLMAHGLAVTWQNPDFSLEHDGAPANSWDLQPDTDYRVRVRVWNASASAPAVGVGVELSYLDFGIGGVSVPVGTTEVDLPVKGAAGTPAVATVDWRTPATPGHYCLQAQLVWPFDAEPGNNMGQHNVQVAAFNSPVARFTVPVRNTGRWPMTVRLTHDAYVLPRPDPCPPRDGQRPARDATRARHAPDRHTLPAGWRLEMEGAQNGQVRVPAGAGVDLQVALVAPDGFVGRQVVNLAGWAGDRLLGGVTLVGEESTS